MILYPGSMESFSREAMSFYWRNKYDAYKYLFLGHYYELLEDSGYTDMNMDLDSFTISLKPISDNFHSRLYLSITHEWMGCNKVFTVFIEADDGFTLDNTFEERDKLIDNPDAIPILEMVRRCEYDHRNDRGI